jgi:hypothetical protein
VNEKVMHYIYVGIIVSRGKKTAGLMGKHVKPGKAVNSGTLRIAPKMGNSGYNHPH